MLEGILGALVVILGLLLFRTRTNRRLDQSLLLAKDQTEVRLLEENKYYKELFELGDASYKESQERIQALMSTLNSKDIFLTRGIASLNEANTNLRKLLRIIDDRNQDITGYSEALKFQEGQYKKLLSQKKSSEVRTGKITEQISPFLALPLFSSAESL